MAEKALELKINVIAKANVFRGKGPEIINRNLTSAMYEAVGFLEAVVKGGTPQGVFGTQGGLISTIHGEVEYKGTPAVKGIVATQSEYGEVIEKGRTPGKKPPPKGSLVRWMEVKLGMDPETAKKKEMGLRIAIGRKGFKGAHMFQNSIEGANYDKLEKIFSHYGFEITRELAQ